MWNKLNIERILKLLLIVAVSMFMLTSCGGKDDEENSERAAVSASVDENTASGHAECWQTGIITMLYENMGSVAMGTYKKITEGALTFMMVAFAVWMSIRLLKHVSSFTEENIGETWTEISRKFFMCFACGYLASSSDGLLFFMNHAIFPIYNAFLEFAGELLSHATAGQESKGYIVLGDKFEAGKAVICKVASTVSNANLEGFPTSPMDMMNCMVCAMNERMNIGFNIAFKVMKAPGFMATVIGLFVLGCFTIVKLAFVFYLVDTIFRFTVMVVMLPILIMGYPFGPTKGWLTTGFKTILNSAAFMMFMAIMIAISMLALEQIMIDNAVIFETGQDKDFQEFSIPFMCIMMIAFLIASSVKVAQQVTNSLVGGDAKGSFNAKAKAVIIGVAKIVGSLFTAGTVGAVSSALSTFKQGRKVLEAAHKAKAKAASFKKKLNALRGK